jgi:hypothetical protein
MSEQRRAQEILALQAAVYQQADPTANEALFRRLIDAVQQHQPTPGRHEAFPTEQASRKLGAGTTGLTVETRVRYPELPTSVFPLLNPETDPLVLVHVRNSSKDERRVQVATYIEGLSTQAVQTVELPPKGALLLKLSPVLLPEKLRELTTVQWATLHVVAQDLDGKVERHDTFPVLCLARTSGFYSSIIDPQTGQLHDLTRYYGAWVTPFVPPVQQLVRDAANLLPKGLSMGYPFAADGTLSAQAVEAQAEALYNALRQKDIAYVHSVISHGTPRGMFMQRIRLPRESLDARSANCLDAAVLMASLLEGASLEPALVLVPGHAFVGWRVGDGDEDWQYLEVAMLRDSDFASARRSGDTQYQAWKGRHPDVRRHSIAGLRAERIWPME